MTCLPLHQNPVLYWVNRMPHMPLVQHSYICFSAHSTLAKMYDISKNSEKSVDSEYAKIERLCIRVCTWSSKMSQSIFSTSLLHDILYTVGFVKMRRIQRYHFNYVNRVGKQPPQQNPVFFRVGTMLMRLWLFNRSVPLKKIKFWIQWYQFHVNPSRTDGGMNILPVFLNINIGKIFMSSWVLLAKIWFWL